MKALAVAVGVTLVLLAALVAAPRFLAGPSGPSGSRSADAADVYGEDAGPLAPPRPDRPIDAPLTREELARAELNRKRLPFYRFLRERFGDLIQHFAVTDEPDTLDVVLSRADDDALQTVLQQAVGPSARQYGFRHVRFHIMNPPGEAEPLALIAEASCDESGRWTTFRK